MAKDLHVVMIPWSAFGHMGPFFQLSVALAKAGVKISFVQTPKNIKRLPKIAPNLATLINLVELPLPALDNDVLPEGAEATVDLPFEKYQYLKTAYDLLKEPFKKFVADQSPDWIFVDVIPYWAAEVALEYEVPLVYFTVFTASTDVFLGSPDYLFGDGQKKLRSSPESLMSAPEWVTFPSSVFFKKHEAAGSFGAIYGSNGTEKSDAYRISKALQSCQAVAVRSCNEFEGDYLSLLENLLGKKVIPAGLLPPEKPQEKDITDETWVKIFKWLDEQKPKSVVFVGFGSECKLSRDQTYEIAYGLELSDVHFLWALRKPTWAKDDIDALPPGFAQRTQGRGVVTLGWAPQMEILGHSSIGGTLFHCGWSSVVETLQFGHTLVALPFVFDQPLNARLLVEKGLAVEIDRGDDGSYDKNDIAKALRLAMVSEEGEGLRARAREAAKVIGDQEKYIVQLVEFLKKGVVNNKGIND
ncbi:putative UDP-rhamnose:rhamnosyltransferase 1 [Durio zibethinus]|uniref:UDP-rhamnose:rhamnosyltransferase 1 n=1 Tax=Durio zibethinus TaxID=66656 RepID=A0A6P6A5D0_DURZI|nr:putative UDP-rhamnose:rhamnosyltransferase 1 [Durio zibethinus]